MNSHHSKAVFRLCIVFSSEFNSHFSVTEQYPNSPFRLLFNFRKKCGLIVHIAIYLCQCGAVAMWNLAGSRMRNVLDVK